MPAADKELRAAAKGLLGASEMAIIEFWSEGSKVSQRTVQRLQHWSQKISDLLNEGRK